MKKKNNLNYELALENALEEVSNLKVIILRLKNEKLELQKQNADLHHQLNIKNYANVMKNNG
jgi:hypothetical protein